MLVALSNYGHRLVCDRLANLSVDEICASPELHLLVEVLEAVALPYHGEALKQQLLARGWLREVPDDCDLQAVKLRYRRNPLENVRRMVFEQTTLCNLACGHCRNSGLEPVTMARSDRLIEAVDLMVNMGVRRFDFIGGEVVLFGNKWLEVVTHIASHPNTTSTVLTSGWFVDETDFVAANQRYADDEAFLAALREAGLTHVVFSLDGPEAVNDEMRGVPGLYAKVIRGFEKVRAAGMSPQVSVVASVPGVKTQTFLGWLVELSTKLYGPVGTRSQLIMRPFHHSRLKINTSKHPDKKLIQNGKRNRHREQIQTK